MANVASEQTAIFSNLPLGDPLWIPPHHGAVVMRDLCSLKTPKYSHTPHWTGLWQRGTGHGPVCGCPPVRTHLWRRTNHPPSIVNGVKGIGTWYTKQSVNPVWIYPTDQLLKVALPNFRLTITFSQCFHFVLHIYIFLNHFKWHLLIKVTKRNVIAIKIIILSTITNNNEIVLKKII